MVDKQQVESRNLYLSVTPPNSRVPSHLPMEPRYTVTCKYVMKLPELIWALRQNPCKHKHKRLFSRYTPASNLSTEMATVLKYSEYGRLDSWPESFREEKNQKTCQYNNYMTVIAICRTKRQHFIKYCSHNSIIGK